MFARSRQLYYGMEFINEFRRSVLGSLQIIYFLSIGLSLIQVTTLYAIGQVALLLFEFPTGAFADSFGRRKSIVFSFLLFSISFIAIFFTTNYYLLIIFNALAIVSWTFQSGTHDAWIIDTLSIGKESDTNGNDKNENSRTKLFSHRFIIGKVGWIVGGLIASAVAFFELKFMWVALALLHFFGFLLLMKYMEEKNFTPSRFKLKEVFSLVKAHSKEALKYSYKNKILLVLFILILFKGLPFSMFAVSWPLLFKEVLAIPVHYFGIIVSVSTFFAMLGAFISKRLAMKRSIPLLLFLFYLVFVVSAFGLGFTSIVAVGIGAFCFFQVGEGGTRPLAQSALHRYIPSSKRASILSLRSMLSGGGSMIGYVIAGPLIAYTGASVGMIVTGVLILVLGIVHSVTLLKKDFNMN